VGKIKAHKNKNSREKTRRGQKMSIYCQKAPQKTEETVKMIEISRISVNPTQPRKVFAHEAILKLADSIRQYGIIQPLLVRKINDTYELVAGERRLRASKELGLKAVPCIITDISELKSAEISIIENLLREDLNIFEQAEAIQALIDTHNLTQEEIATKLSNSQSFVANKLRLLRFSSAERELILKNNLTERHARALLRIADPVLRDKILGAIINEGLNVASTDELIESYLAKRDGKTSVSKGNSKGINAFYSTINRAIDTVKGQGIGIKCRRVENDDYTELTIIVPKNVEIEPEKEDCFT
jgi:ParB family chromosome partitioning protein